MVKRSQTFQELPINIVGSTEFGRYPKMSSEVTYNMVISDGYLVPFAGHDKRVVIDTQGSGRGIFNSEKFGKLIVVIDDGIYTVDSQEKILRIGTIETSAGDVFMDENDAGQIAICDKKNIYIYATATGVLTKVTLDFTPGYVAFHDTYFIAPDINNSKWRLSGNNDGLNWNVLDTGLFQTKPDNPVAIVRLPGKGNQILVFGNIVTESWQDVGAQLFPYQRSTGFNIDYGVLNPATIASSDTFVVWLGINEKSGPAIMYTEGGNAAQISNDGINFKLAQLKNPSASYGYLFKQDGHLFYVISFIDTRDNFSLAYDFTTQKFVSLCDEYMNYHIAKKVVFFNNKYYFISFRDGDLYEINSIYTTYDGAEIPRIRITNNARAKDASPFIANNLTFTIEQGEDSNAPVYSINPMVQTNNISIAADFPLLSLVKAGNIFSILADVFDNDPYATNTGKSFLAGQQIVWIDNTWQVIENRIARVDLSVSYDGGVTFGSSYGIELNPEGERANRMVFWNLGYANDMVLQLRFWGLGRFVVTDGLLSIYQ